MTRKYHIHFQMTISIHVTRYQPPWYSQLHVVYSGQSPRSHARAERSLTRQCFPDAMATPMSTNTRTADATIHPYTVAMSDGMDSSAVLATEMQSPALAIFLCMTAT